MIMFAGSATLNYGCKKPKEFFIIIVPLVCNLFEMWTFLFSLCISQKLLGNIVSYSKEKTVGMSWFLDFCP